MDAGAGRSLRRPFIPAATITPGRCPLLHALPGVPRPLQFAHIDDLAKMVRVMRSNVGNQRRVLGQLLVVGILHKHIRNLDRLLILWSGVALVGLCRDVLQNALVALGRFKSLAWQVGVSAAVAVVVMWYGLGRWGAPGVLVGMIVGELINLAGIILLLRKCMREALIS